MATRPSLSALQRTPTSIFANPYGGPSNDEINEAAAGIETGGARDARVMHEQRMRDLEEELMSAKLRTTDPRRKVMEDAWVEDYNTGRFNSPQGFRAREAERRKFDYEWDTQAPAREYGMEKAKLQYETPGLMRQSIAALQSQGRSDVAEQRAAADILGRIIQQQGNQDVAQTNAAARIAAGGVTSAADVPGAMQKFKQAAPGSKGIMPMSKIMQIARAENWSVNQAIMAAIVDGYQIKYE